MLPPPADPPASVTADASGEPGVGAPPLLTVPPAGALPAVAVTPARGVTALDGSDVAVAPSPLTARTLNATASSLARPVTVALVASPGTVLATDPAPTSTSQCSIEH